MRVRRSYNSTRSPRPPGSRRRRLYCRWLSGRWAGGGGAVEHLQEAIGVDRLDQVGVEPGLDRAGAGVVLAVTGEGDHERALGERGGEAPPVQSARVPPRFPTPHPNPFAGASPQPVRWRLPPARSPAPPPSPFAGASPSTRSPSPAVRRGRGRGEGPAPVPTAPLPPPLPQPRQRPRAPVGAAEGGGGDAHGVDHRDEQVVVGRAPEYCRKRPVLK